MMHKHPLRSIYSRMLGDEQMKSVKHFFSSFLELPAASLFDVVEELKDLSSNHSKGLEIATDMYTYLSCLDISTVELRYAFGVMTLSQRAFGRELTRRQDRIRTSTTYLRKGKRRGKLA